MFPKNLILVLSFSLGSAHTQAQPVYDVTCDTPTGSATFEFAPVQLSRISTRKIKIQQLLAFFTSRGTFTMEDITQRMTIEVFHIPEVCYRECWCCC